MTDLKGSMNDQKRYNKIHQLIEKRAMQEFVLYKGKDKKFLEAQMLATDLQPVVEVFIKYRPSKYFKKWLHEFTSNSFLKSDKHLGMI